MDLVESQSVDAIMSALSAMGARSTRDPARGSRRGGGVAGVDDSTHSRMSNTNTVSYKHPPQMQYYSAASSRSSHGSLNDLDRRSGASSAGQSSSRAGGEGKTSYSESSNKIPITTNGEPVRTARSDGSWDLAALPLSDHQSTGSWLASFSSSYVAVPLHMVPRVAINQR